MDTSSVEEPVTAFFDLNKKPDVDMPEAPTTLPTPVPEYAAPTPIAEEPTPSEPVTEDAAYGPILFALSTFAVEADAVRAMFPEFDALGDDTMEAAKFQDLMNSGLHGEYSEEQMESMSDQLQVSSSGKVAFADFLSWWVCSKTDLSYPADYEDDFLKGRYLAPGVFIITRRVHDMNDTTMYVRYELRSVSAMDVKINFEGSENIDIVGGGPGVVDTETASVLHEGALFVQPYRRTLLAEVKQADAGLGFRLKVKYVWSEQTRGILVARLDRAHNEQMPLRLQRYLDFQRQSGFRPEVDSPQSIASSLASQPELTEFLDVRFPSNADSIYGGDGIWTPWTIEKFRIQQALKEKVVAKGKDVGWRRALAEPKGFCEGPPIIVVGEIEPLDVKQGALGDCWLMSALASVSKFPYLVRKLVDEEGVPSEGMYRVLLHKSGRWMTVTVDDHFPVRSGGKPLFSRANGDELWVLLLEKAYAKVHGSYHTLIGGFTREGLSDLTGMPTYEVKLTTLGAEGNC